MQLYVIKPCYNEQEEKYFFIVSSYFIFLLTGAVVPFSVASDSTYIIKNVIEKLLNTHVEWPC